MKIFLLIPALILSLCSAAAPKETVTPASDARITYVGRTCVQGGDVSFDWTGVYLRLAFEGRYLAVRVSDTHKNYYNVWLDRDMAGEPDKVVSTFGRDSLIVLFDEKDIPSRGSHRVILQKRTEAEQGRTTLHSFTTRGDLLQAEGLRPRLLEFVGDSYTCGYGAENSVRTDPFKPETENQNKTYAAILSRYFGADRLVIAHSGQGIARNYGDGGRGLHMPDRYGYVFDCDPSAGTWDAASHPYRPDMTIIYLCTNDFSTGRQPTAGEFTAHYRRLLEAVKANYGPAHKILCVAGPGDPLMPQYVQAAVAASGMEQVWAVNLCPMGLDSDGDLGASWHPSYAGHRKWAHALLPYVATITGWPLEDKVLK
ncbi:MAG: GDSL family lipase [Bacteroidales bacterium]|nr:GDSL family lipase [Bacteroidales bacterium]